VKIGLIADVHGNIDALIESTNYLQNHNVEKIIFLGDVVGYLPWAHDCFKLLQKLNIECIKGNHEHMLLGTLPIKPENEDVYKLAHAKQQFSTQELGIIANWKDKIEITTQKFTYLLVHGSPTNFSNGYIYPDTELTQFQNQPYNTIIMAHTHRPFVKVHNQIQFVNIGSVGLPRDTGNLSSFAILDTETNAIEILRLQSTQEQLNKIQSEPNIHPQVKKLQTRAEPAIVGTIVQ
jgi:putative phosphoesterase